jgi:hypothetical protein
MMASACSRRFWSAAVLRRSAASSAASGWEASALGPRLAGVRAVRVPAARWRRQSVSDEEYSPSAPQDGANLSAAGGAVRLLQNAQLLLGSEGPPFRPLGHLRIGGGRWADSFIGHNHEIGLLRPQV